MKKFLGTLLVVLVVVLGIFMWQKNEPVTPKNEEKSLTSQEEVIKNNEENSENEEKPPVKEEDKEEIAGSGMFLGQTDSNFVVIFTVKENKDIQYKIGKDVNIDEIELGAAVDFKYTVSETDEKTLTYIKPRK